MDKSTIMDLVKTEVLSYRYKVWEQLKTRGLDGNNLISLQAPILPNLNEDEVVAVCSCFCDINKIHEPFLPLSVWAKITTRPMPVLFEELYPLADSRFIGPVCKVMKSDFKTKNKYGFITYMPWTLSGSVSKFPVLFAFRGTDLEDLNKDLVPFNLSLLLSGFDLFPTGSNYPSAISNNYGTLFDTAQEFRFVKFSVDKMIQDGLQIQESNIVLGQTINALGSLNEYLEINQLRHISDGPEPDWTKADEKFYGKVLSSAFART
jgi:hypothetical protein